MSEKAPNYELSRQVIAWCFLGIGGCLLAASQTQPWESSADTTFDFASASTVICALYFIAMLVLLVIAGAATMLTGPTRKVLVAIGMGLILAIWPLIIGITRSRVPAQTASIAAGAWLALSALACIGLAIGSLVIDDGLGPPSIAVPADAELVEG